MTQEIELEQKNGEATGQPLWRVPGYPHWSPSPEKAREVYLRSQERKQREDRK
jgi:hypothetical protein